MNDKISETVRCMPSLCRYGEAMELIDNKKNRAALNIHTHLATAVSLTLHCLRHGCIKSCRRMTYESFAPTESSQTLTVMHLPAGLCCRGVCVCVRAHVCVCVLWALKQASRKTICEKDFHLFRSMLPAGAAPFLYSLSRRPTERSRGSRKWAFYSSWKK